MADRIWKNAVNLGPYACADVPTETKCQFWHFAKTFTGALLDGPTTPGAWTVLGSAGYVDAVWGGALDGIDRLGATYDPANLLQAAAGANHTWLALQAPASFGNNTGQYYAVLEMLANNACNLIIGKTAPTGGSATASPTISDANKFTVSLPTLNGDYGNYRPSTLLSDKGDVIATNQFVGDVVNYLWVLATLAGPHAIDAYPVAALAIASTSGALSPISLGASTAIKMKSHTGNADVTGYIMLGTCYNGATSALSAMNAADAVSGQMPEIPAYAMIMTGGHASIRGRLPDIFVVPPSSTGYVRPSVGQQTGQSLGYLMFPFTDPVATS